jgi:uncharacterized membrane protein SirB2
MSRRTVVGLAWSLWAMTLGLIAGGLLIGVTNRPEAPLYDYWIESTLITPTFATLGVLIVSRRPGNVIGWIFLALSVAGSLQMFSGQYATVALISDSKQLPGGAFAAWLSTLMQSSFVYPILFLVLLFPTGKLLSPRLRVVAWTAGLVIVASLVSLALRPGRIENFPSARNPFEGPPFVEWVEAAGGVLGPAYFVAAIIALILRFRRSRGEERQQIKWFAYASALGFMAILLVTLFDLPVVDERTDALVEHLVWTVAPLSLPVSAGIAILKYRLYEIDIIINRTLVYGSLTALLAAVYFGGVAATQAIFRALTGQQEQPQLAIVVSTLVIAALFIPLRRRIQSFIDRRFYRRKYDARKTLEAFSAKLRDETDLDALNAELVSVVRETMQPAHVSLWLRPDTASKKDEAPS